MVRAISRSLVVLLFAVAVGCGGGDDEPVVNSSPNFALRAQLAQRGAYVPPATATPAAQPAASEPVAAQPAAAAAPTAAPVAQPAATRASADSDEQLGGGPAGAAANDMDSFNAALLADSAGEEDGGDEDSGFEGMSSQMSDFDRALLADSMGEGDTDDESSGFEAMGGAPASIGTSGVAGPGALAGAGGAAGGRRPMPTGYKGSSMLAFRAGKDREGMQHMLAHALTNDDGAAETLPTIQWIAGLKRPALAVRWGVAIQLIAPRKFDEDPKPIGSTQEFEGDKDDEDGGGGGGSGGDEFGSGGDEFGSGGDEGGSGGGSGGDFGMGGGPGAGDGTSEELSKYTGEFGEFVLEEIQARVEEGYFGETLRTAAMRGTGGGGGRNVEFGGPDSFGSAPGGGRSGRSSRSRSSEPEIESISTGVSFVGLSDKKNADELLITKAAADGIDVLALFRVTIKKNVKKEFITNETVCSLYDPIRNVRLVRTRTLSNVKVQRAREEEEDDGIEEQIINLMTYTDTNLSMSALPAGLNNDNVQGRVSYLASRQHEDMLEVLTEISFWNSQGLLSDQGKTEAFQGLLGDHLGSQLASGSEDDRKEAIEDWLSSKKTERGPFLSR